MKLRDNQVEPVDKGVDYLKSTKPPSLIIAPTAFGKSVVISTIAHRLQEPILVLQPSKELLEQNLSKLRAMGGDAKVYSASLKTKEIGDITYATLGSIKSTGKDFKGYKMIIDEADRYPRTMDSMLGKFLRDSEIKQVLGLTATPIKLQTNSFMMQSYSLLKFLTARGKTPSFFKDIIHITQIQEMVEKGYWAKLIYEQHDFDSDGLVYNSTQAEFTDESMTAAYHDQGIEAKIARRVEASNRKSILIFVPAVSDAVSLAAKIPGSVAVYGNMDTKERTAAINGFKDGSIRVIINVNVLSVGFDHPALDTIICGRPTASLSWYYQALGRGTRIHPDKKSCLIIDFSGNVNRFGPIDKLYYAKEKLSWKLFGEGGKLLTGIPMHEIGKHWQEKPSLKLAK